jgi:hypothetical protein
VWLAELLNGLDQFFLGLGGNRLAFAAALFVLAASTAAFYRVTPMRLVRRCVGTARFVNTGMRFGYGAGDLYRMLDAYRAPEGKREGACRGLDLYKAHRLFIALDMIYPLLYAPALAVMLGCLLPHALPPEQNRTHYLTLVPLTAGLCDVVENLSLLHVVNRHEADPATPPEWHWLAAFSSLMTSVKLMLLSLTLLVLLACLLVVVLS